jgi:hypothetical protein
MQKSSYQPISLYTKALSIQQSLSNKAYPTKPIQQSLSKQSKPYGPKTATSFALLPASVLCRPSLALLLPGPEFKPAPTFNPWTGPGGAPDCGPG